MYAHLMRMYKYKVSTIIVKFIFMQQTQIYTNALKSLRQSNIVNTRMYTNHRVGSMVVNSLLMVFPFYIFF